MADMKKITQPKRSVEQDVITNNYDEFPYVSYPFDYTRPEHLRAIAKLFGLPAAKIENAKILELGCSSGGNITRFAADYPRSHTVGVDISAVELKEGEHFVKKLKLKNIDLKHLSIIDLDKSFGEFDYIICHGIISWVPEEVRMGILKVFQQLLTKNGVALLSYNTLPGWNFQSTIKDLMSYHARDFNDPVQKLSQGRLMMNFMADALEEVKTPYAQFIRAQAGNIAKKEDHYIRHDYLSDQNKAYYFHDMIDLARERDLEYVGDADLQRMYVGNLPKKAAEKLAGINDIIKTEQYIDFVRNAQFRASILCRKGQPVNRNINFEQLKEFNFFARVNSESKITPELLESNETVTFNFNNNKAVAISSANPNMKALLYCFMKKPGYFYSVDELIKEGTKNNKSVTKESLTQEFSNYCGRLILAGYLKLVLDKPKHVYKISAKPKVSDYAREQVDYRFDNQKIWITNQINQVVVVGAHQKYVVRLLDGKRTIKQVADDIYQKMKEGIIVAKSSDNTDVTDEKEMRMLAEKIVDTTLNNLKNSFALIG